jgi:hypothetical protein
VAPGSALCVRDGGRDACFCGAHSLTTGFSNLKPIHMPQLYKNQVARAPAVSLLVRSWRTYKQRKFFVKYSAVRIKNR